MDILHVFPGEKGPIHVYSKYLHINSVKVEEGQTARQGDVIGTMGDSGCAHFGCFVHVHFEVNVMTLDNQSKGGSGQLGDG